MNRFVKDTFDASMEPTMGVGFGTRHLSIPYKNVKIQIWDTSGRENFRCITRAYYRGAACVLIVFDVGSSTSFLSVCLWLKEIKAEAPNAQIMLVGSKMDQDERVITTEEANEFAKENQLLYSETSAKSGENVEEAFLVCAETFLNRLENGEVDDETLRTRALNSRREDDNALRKALRFSSTFQNIKRGIERDCCGLL